MSKKGAYPQQQSYPTQQPTMAPPKQQPTAQAAQAPPYTEAPPSYAELHQQPRFVQAPPGYPGGFYVPRTSQMQMGPPGAAVPIQYYAVPQVFSPSSTVVVKDGFDAGARFGAGATANIPVSVLNSWCYWYGYEYSVAQCVICDC
ncbi:DAZ-associated protein 2-like [Stegostoma tigrinum]|uniref:DAZ-associated protein 2-like n=1 Tax=Stegostoma tigrinum TaxID=3053191 RepID=UPI00286FBBE1|nr:DAZ-associated protein 2-like [Stegostoma tigrinum]XP_059500375.1 DAZ-associated protein 2-like [Stegostoma tigrinum]